MKGVEPTRLEAFRRQGFVPPNTAPVCAAALFASSAALVGWWFARGIVIGDIYTYEQALLGVGLSSMLFYAATLVFFLWALAAVRRHESSELLVHLCGADALSPQSMEPGDEMVQRWEQRANRFALFLVVALPIALSPTLGAHLFLVGVVWGHELVMPALCFALAGVFHVWATLLAVGLYNDHLSFEARELAASMDAEGERPLPASLPVEDGTTARRELAAIMLTDMVGYSKDMERDEARAYAKLLEHNQVMRGAVSAHHGREIKTIGDAFLVIFKSAIDAVDCALTVQRAFADLNLNRDEADRMLVRIGIHIGDVLVTNNDVFGDGVNVAARIEPQAEPGGICISEPVFEMVRKKLQLDVSKIEGIKLKNIAVSPSLYRIRLGA